MTIHPSIQLMGEWDLPNPSIHPWKSIQWKMTESSIQLGMNLIKTINPINNQWMIEWKWKNPSIPWMNENLKKHPFNKRMNENGKKPSIPSISENDKTIHPRMNEWKWRNHPSYECENEKYIHPMNEWMKMRKHPSK